MRLFTSNILGKVARRYMCSKNAVDNPSKIIDESQTSKHLKNFLSEDSPLKNYKDKNEWATTNQPADIQSEKAKDDSEKIDPESTSIIVFPGQGNQFVGMGKALMENSVVKDMFDVASSILKYDLKKLCLHGPKEKLAQTEYCQLATVVCSLAALEELKIRYPLAIPNCIATSGFSVGEIPALVFAGSISFEDGKESTLSRKTQTIRITKVRAEAMQKCSESVRSGMITVLYGCDSHMKEAMRDAKKECSSQGISEPVCEVANYLFAECKVLGGHEVALKYIEENQKKYKLRKILKLPVSGAFHTTLMKEAALPFWEALRKVKIKKPLVPVCSNCEIYPYKNELEIRKILPKQIYKPVKWEQILHYLYSRTPGTGFPHTYECGPGNSLSAILKRVNFTAYHNCHKIET